MKNQKIALIQMAMSADSKANLMKALDKIQESSRLGASMVCLPELFPWRYFCQTEDISCFDLAESIPGPISLALCKAAKRAKVFVLAPIFERRTLGLYHNSTVIIDPRGEITGLYRKMHIPDDPGYYEKYYFAPGDLGFPVFDTGTIRMATLTCWDQWFPEAARILALKGTAVIFYPTAIGWHANEKEAIRLKQREAWRTIQKAHAIANGIFVASVNRTGIEKAADGGSEIQFWGSSFIADPFGNIIAEGSTSNEEIIIGEIDWEEIERVRRNWPFLRDRRVEVYSELNQLYAGDK
ncbi:MAG: carbon-nitrogen hydrolase [Deltaproteobacteria bacterium]|nr:carbon-nitrogen hydrolase [Deltaproteobacteria bacterium]